jgi:hypothetical protein
MFSNICLPGAVAVRKKINPDTVEDAGGNNMVLILAGLGSVAICMMLAAMAFLRFDGELQL